jgi:hypothetical protein
MTTMYSSNPAGRFVPWMLKFLVGFSVCEIVVLGIVGVVLKLPSQRLLSTFLILLLPAVAAGPLFYFNHSFADRPRLRSFLFAIAVCVFSFLFQLAVLFSVIYVGLIPRTSGTSWIPYAAGGSLIGFAGAYYEALRRLSPKNPPPVRDGPSSGP